MKFPRTYHLPWSENLQNDDRRIETLDFLEGREVWMTEKLDGENTSFHSDKIHARSEENSNHPSRSMVKALYGSIQGQIPPHLQIVGENMYAKHSIFYDKLTAYFYVFAIIDKERNMFLSRTQTEDICENLGLKLVPTLWAGTFKKSETEKVKRVLSEFGEEAEGYVIRVAESFGVEEYPYKAAKFVRSDHVRTDEHWMKKWTLNQLVES